MHKGAMKRNYQSLILTLPTFIKGEHRPVTQEKIKAMERIGLFEEEAE